MLLNMYISTILYSLNYIFIFIIITIIILYGRRIDVVLLSTEERTTVFLF